MEKLCISFILPVIDEVSSLQKTVEMIIALARSHAVEILIVVADKTTSESVLVARDLRRKYGGVVNIYKQKLPGLGGAIREAIDVVRGDYVMLMASDFETDPAAIPDFIDRMSEGRWDIVCGSRWLMEGGFKGYGLIKMVMNWIFQRFVGVLYRVRLTDLTFAYRLYRREVLLGIEWEELRHPFLLECLLKPLLLGARVTEIPCRWRARSQGVSNNSIWQMFRYVPLAVRIRCADK